MESIDEQENVNPQISEQQNQIRAINEMCKLFKDLNDSLSLMYDVESSWSKVKRIVTNSKTYEKWKNDAKPLIKNVMDYISPIILLCDNCGNTVEDCNQINALALCSTVSRVFHEKETDLLDSFSKLTLIIKELAEKQKFSKLNLPKRAGNLTIDSVTSRVYQTPMRIPMLYDTLNQSLSEENKCDKESVSNFADNMDNELEKLQEALEEDKIDFEDEDEITQVNIDTSEELLPIDDNFPDSIKKMIEWFGNKNLYGTEFYNRFVKKLNNVGYEDTKNKYKELMSSTFSQSFFQGTVWKLDSSLPSGKCFQSKILKCDKALSQIKKATKNKNMLSNNEYIKVYMMILVLYKYNNRYNQLIESSKHVKNSELEKLNDSRTILILKEQQKEKLRNFVEQNFIKPGVLESTTQDKIDLSFNDFFKIIEEYNHLFYEDFDKVDFDKKVKVYLIRHTESNSNEWSQQNLPTMIYKNLTDVDPRNTDISDRGMRMLQIQRTRIKNNVSILGEGGYNPETKEASQKHYECMRQNPFMVSTLMRAQKTYMALFGNNNKQNPDTPDSKNVIRTQIIKELLNKKLRKLGWPQERCRNIDRALLNALLCLYKGSVITLVGHGLYFEKFSSFRETKLNNCEIVLYAGNYIDEEPKYKGIDKKRFLKQISDKGADVGYYTRICDGFQKKRNTQFDLSGIKEVDVVNSSEIEELFDKTEFIQTHLHVRENKEDVNFEMKLLGNLALNLVAALRSKIKNKVPIYDLSEC